MPLSFPKSEVQRDAEGKGSADALAAAAFTRRWLRFFGWAEARIPYLCCTHQGLRIARRCVKHKRAGDLDALDERNWRHTKDLNKCGKDWKSIFIIELSMIVCDWGKFLKVLFQDDRGWRCLYPKVRRCFSSQLRGSMMRLSTLLAVCDRYSNVRKEPQNHALKDEGVKASEIMINENKRVNWILI